MFYVFHGEDAYAKNHALSQLKAKMGDANMLSLNTTHLNGIGMTMHTLRDACATMPFLSPQRLVIVENLFSQPKKPLKAFQEELIDFLPSMPDSCRVVFMESKALTEKNRLVKLAKTEEAAYQKRYDALNEGQVQSWIAKRVRKAGGDIEGRASHLLSMNVGNSRQILENEVEKLLLFADGKKITQDMVMLLSPYAAESNIFALMDAIGDRKAKTAVILLNDQLSAGQDPFYLFAMIIRQFRLLIQVKELANANYRAPEIAKMIKQHPFVVGKIFAQAKGFSMSALEQVYRHLLDIDLGIKTGERDLPTSLSILVSQLVSN